MVRWTMALVSALLVGIPQLAQALTEYDLIQVIDPTDATFTVSGGTLSTTPGDGTVVLPLNLSGNTAVLELAMVGSETSGTLNTEFDGTLMLEDGSADPLLVVAVGSIVVTNLGMGLGGQPGTFLNLGGLDTASQSEVTLLGGTAADQFGGAGTIGQMFISLTELTGPPVFLPGSFFAADFTSPDTTIQVLFHTPEPGTGLLMGASLAAMAAWRRRYARR